jgi:hypothetical protein
MSNNQLPAQPSNILDGLLKMPAPKTASFTFICENAAFKDEGFVPSITASQYQRIKAILSEQGKPEIILPGQDRA